MIRALMACLALAAKTSSFLSACPQVLALSSSLYILTLGSCTLQHPWLELRGLTMC